MENPLEHVAEPAARDYLGEPIRGAEFTAADVIAAFCAGYDLGCEDSG
jgi:hypothetical protein